MNYYATLGMLFVGCLLTANILGPKPVDCNFFTVPAGLLIFPLTYMLGVVATEVYGFRKSRQIIWMALLCNIFLAGACQIAILLPYDLNWAHQAAYATTLGTSSKLIIISVCTYCIGELLNAFCVHYLKNKLRGKYFFVRGLLGNWIGETVETLLFIPLAFSYLSQETLVKLIIFYICFKLTYALLMMPFANGLVVMLKSKEFKNYRFN